MAASFLCHDCIPEGTKLSRVPLLSTLLSIEAGPPRHCRGKNNRTTPGLIGGYLCSCPCAQEPRASGQQIMPPEPRENGRTCPGGDTTCPCIDGDACHYEQIGDSPPMSPPEGGDR